MKKVVVISVHPDDETLGCGGTLLKHKQNGDSVNCIFVTAGNEQQQVMIDKLSAFYQFESVYSLNLPEISLADLPLGDIIAPLSRAINSIEPEVLYIPNRSDAHSDHRAVFEALIACTKSFRHPFIKRILMCEVISETDFAPALQSEAFIPTVFVDISEVAEQKKEALKIFETELMEAPYTRSYRAIEALEIYRGSQINAHKAESFMLLKAIE